MIRQAWQQFDRWSVAPLADIENGPARSVAQVLDRIDDAIDRHTWRIVIAYIRHLRRQNTDLTEKYGREVLAVEAENRRLAAALGRAEGFIHGAGMGHIYTVAPGPEERP